MFRGIFKLETMGIFLCDLKFLAIVRPVVGEIEIRFGDGGTVLFDAEPHATRVQIQRSGLEKADQFVRSGVFLQIAINLDGFRGIDVRGGQGVGVRPVLYACDAHVQTGCREDYRTRGTQKLRQAELPFFTELRQKLFGGSVGAIPQIDNQQGKNIIQITGTLTIGQEDIYDIGTQRQQTQMQIFPSKAPLEIAQHT